MHERFKLPGKTKSLNHGTKSSQKPAENILLLTKLLSKVKDQKLKIKDEFANLRILKPPAPKF